MLLLDGCVQPALIPVINAAAARVLDRAGISVVVPPEAGCCGALSLHLGATAEAERYMRRNIDAWWPEIEKGCEAIVMTASGCGVTVREYGQLLARDRAYAEKAARISSLTLDLSEVVAVEKPSGLPNGNERRVAYHAPCTLQHGQKVHGQVEELLQSLWVAAGNGAGGASLLRFGRQLFVIAAQHRESVVAKQTGGTAGGSTRIDCKRKHRVLASSGEGGSPAGSALDRIARPRKPYVA